MARNNSSNVELQMKSFSKRITQSVLWNHIAFVVHNKFHFVTTVLLLFRHGNFNAGFSFLFWVKNISCWVSKVIFFSNRRNSDSCRFFVFKNFKYFLLLNQDYSRKISNSSVSLKSLQIKRCAFKHGRCRPYNKWVPGSPGVTFSVIICEAKLINMLNKQELKGKKKW